jgi:alcohol dehydrogenase
VITDTGIVKAGIIDQVVESLKEAGFEVGIWDEVAVEPTEESIEAGYKAIKDFDPDIFIGVGGGSSLDTAKMIAGLMTNPKKFVEYFDPKTGVGCYENPPKPILAVPTTAGTGSETTWYAVVSLKGVPGKVGFVDAKLIPPIAVVDPGLTVGLPPKITANTGIDALTHLFEGYLSIATNPFNEALAFEAARIIPIYLRKATYHGNDLIARFQMMLQATLGGIAINYGYVNEGHIFGHMLGWKYHIPHGVAQGLALPYCCLEYNIPVFPKEIANLAKCWGLEVDGLTEREAAYKLIHACVKLLKDLGMPWKLSQVPGAKKEDLPELAKFLTQTPYFISLFKICCKRVSTEAECLALLERMYDGVFLE